MIERAKEFVPLLDEDCISLRHFVVRARWTRGLKET